MSDIQLKAADDLARRVHQSAQADRRQRVATVLAWLTVAVVVILCAGMFWVEFENVSLALRQLFPTLRDGSSDLDGTHTLAFASVGAILFGDVVLVQASQGWSESARRRVYYVGLAALALFAVSAMILIPTSIWQANDASQDSGGAVSQGAYLAFALMLAGLFPLGLIANFTLLKTLAQALGKIAQNLPINQRIGRKLRTLAQREKVRAKLRQIERHRAHAPTDERLVEECASRVDAVIGEVRGQLRQVIAAREVGSGSADDPVTATEVLLLNLRPIEQLQAQLTYLQKFTPQFIRQRMLQEDFQS